MSSLQLCPTCFAESYLVAICDFCGTVMDAQSQEQPVSTNSKSNEEQSGFELAGLPVSAEDWASFPRGTLLVERYSLLQWKQSLEGGECYIAFDNRLGSHCFVTIWPQESALHQFHDNIQFASTVYDIGQNPRFSVFTPQEGLPLEQGLGRLGWNHGRVWEVFRQICLLVSGVHSAGHLVQFIHHQNFWIRPDGQLEFSLQPFWSAVSESVHEEVQDCIRLLGWLFVQSDDVHWGVFPLKIRSILQQHWENSHGIDSLWTELTDAISNVGLWRLSGSIKSELLDRHAPNVIQVDENIISVPNSVQLCIWNAVTGSWRLKQGRVLLRSTMESLFENGFVDVEDMPRQLHLFEEIVAGDVDQLVRGTFFEVQQHLVYGNRRQARIWLSTMIPNMSQMEDWCILIQALCTIKDFEDAQEIVQIARKRIDFLREALDLASVVKWHVGELHVAIQILKQNRHLVRDIWDAMEWVEAYVAITGHVERQEWCQPFINTAEYSICLEVYKGVQETFGSLTNELLPWLAQRLHD